MVKPTHKILKMENFDIDKLKYPIGKPNYRRQIAPARIQENITQISLVPDQFKAAISDLSDEQLNTPYRPEGWTVRQLVHHVPESHMNAYIRFKWCLTEDNPVIKTYYEDRWAETEDAKHGPVQMSLDLLTSLHARWMALLTTMTDQDFEKTFQHPVSGILNLGQMTELYAWHGQHHTAHITALRERKGW